MGRRVGHSWGGHLAIHVAETMPERLLGVLAVDPLGSVGDGRWPEFDEEMFRRTPEAVRERARELDDVDGRRGLRRRARFVRRFDASPATSAGIVP